MWISVKNLDPMGLAVFVLFYYLQTDRQEKFIYRWIFEYKSWNPRLITLYLVYRNIYWYNGSVGSEPDHVKGCSYGRG